MLEKICVTKVLRLTTNLVRRFANRPSIECDGVQEVWMKDQAVGSQENRGDSCSDVLLLCNVLKHLDLDFSLKREIQQGSRRVFRQNQIGMQTISTVTNLSINNGSFGHSVYWLFSRTRLRASSIFLAGGPAWVPTTPAEDQCLRSELEYTGKVEQTRIFRKTRPLRLAAAQVNRGVPK
ncbi:hypothetical protein CLF_111772 [Clonorchis sinensis]|uniref:Uncharacterized protein n=1 Tax=Clonorchis sinensis TaxID=79923 RepID=G7YLY7_CLOSI|nr:hypothetical protein CLF_111772 [Clonorchis sinensis]